MNNYILTMRCADGSIAKLECHDALPSTARLAKEYAKAGYPDRYIVFAEGRKKLDADGKYKADVEKGVYMSCILRPSIFPSQAGLMNSLAAVALCSALEEHTDKKVGIGWVSNIYCDGKLIGKVNIEGKLDDFTSYEYIIITFTVETSAENFPPRLTDIIKKVFDDNNTSIAMIIAKNILNKFFPFYSNFKNSSKFMDIYKRKFALRGQKVRYTDGEKKQTCKVLGVSDDDCALMLETPNKKIIKVSAINKIALPKKIKMPNN